MPSRYRRAVAIAATALFFMAALAGCTPAGKGGPGKPATGGKTTAADQQPALKPDRVPPVAPARPTYAFNTVPPKPAKPDDLYVIDFRYADLRKLDLTGSQDLLTGYAIFNGTTQWPAKLPAGFDPKQVLEAGKDPGLGIRELQKQGITGKGVHVAIIDQTLYLDHPEYKDRLAAYHEIKVENSIAQAHGGAAASILAGKSVGVAPDVRLTYYAVPTVEGSAFTYKYTALALNRILDANVAAAKAADRIHVVVIPASWQHDAGDSLLLDDAIARAHREGVFVVSGSMETEYKVRIQGVGRDPASNANVAGSYRPARVAESAFYSQSSTWVGLHVPVDSHTVAGPAGKDDYAFLRSGAISLAPPYLAGVYALAKQVLPSLTPEEFLGAAWQTGSTTTFTNPADGKAYQIGPVINPPALIQAVRAAAAKTGK